MVGTKAGAKLKDDLGVASRDEPAPLSVYVVEVFVFSGVGIFILDEGGDERSRSRLVAAALFVFDTVSLVLVFELFFVRVDFDFDSSLRNGVLVAAASADAFASCCVDVDV